MWRLFAFGMLALSLAALPADVWGQKKDKKDDKNKQATPADYAQLKNAKELVGQIVSIDANGGTVTIRVDHPDYVANPNWVPNGNGTVPGEVQRLLRDQQIAMAHPNPVSRQNALLRINRDMQRLQNATVNQAKGISGPFKAVKNLKEYELPLTEKPAIRKSFIGTVYDDKGNIKTFTAAELTKLKGNGPGYAAKIEEVQPGQEAVVYLSPPKTEAKKGEAAFEDKDAKKDAKEVEKPRVRIVLLTKEMSAMQATTDAKKK